MRIVTKKIEKVTYAGAALSMSKHEAKMILKGWSIVGQSSGKSLDKYNFVTVFMKGL